jgi:hypothetical protein
MSAGDVLAAVALVAILALAAGLTAALVTLNRTLAVLRDTADDLRRTTVPLVIDARSSVDRATAELDRVDGLLGTAESIQTTVNSASRLAYLAFSNPMVKALAFGSGAASAGRRLRRGRR